MDIGAWSRAWYEACSRCCHVELVILIDDNPVCEECFIKESEEGHDDLPIDAGGRADAIRKQIHQGLVEPPKP